MSLPDTYKALYGSKTFNGKPEIKEVKLEKPGKNQVLIKVAYAPINLVDSYGMKNIFNSPEQQIVGNEGSGTIVAVGENLEHPFKVGDKVHFLLESMGQYRLLETGQVFPLQDDLSLEKAASHWINPVTVYYMAVLAQRGGHKVVVQTAAASAVGRMVIRYFKKLGIKTINVVRRQEHIEDLKKEGGDYVLDSTDKDFAKNLKDLCEKENAHIAFDAIAGDFTNIVVTALPKDSTCWVYGVLSSMSAHVDVLQLFNKKRVEGLACTNYIDERTEKGEFRALTAEVHVLLSTVLSSKVQKVFKLEDLEQALEFFNEHGTKGRVLLQLN